jgi:hypothetical protein
MGPAEIAHRVREAARKASWRGYDKGWDGFDSGGEGTIVVPAILKERLQARHPAGVEAGMRASAAMARTRRFAFLGTTWPTTAPSVPVAWLLDPVSGQLWEGADRYCFDVDHRHAKGRGDVKLVWELSRLQFLPWLAAEDGEGAMALLASWMDQNPPFRGVNWNSGIELALRLVSLLLTLAALREPPSPSMTRLVARFVSAHAFWLARYPSLYSSANNHLMSEGLGLLVAALILPGHRDARTWESHGRAIFERETLLQFLADGVGAEQSPTYTAFSAEMVALGVLLARDAGRPLSPAVTERLALVATWLRAMMDRNGQLPRIGDDDEGRVVAAPPDREPRYVASVVASIAGLLDRPDLLPPGRDPHPRDAIFGSPEGIGALDTGLKVFPDGGYSVVRETDANGCEWLLAFDHGPLGYLSIAAHGHADTLSLWLHRDGEPLLVDAGTYLYHAAGPWRGAFCGTGAHNTLKLSVDSSTQVGPFLWSQKARGRLLEAHDGSDWRLSAAHDGYRERFGVEHVRSLRCRDATIHVSDRLEGQRDPMDVTISWLFHPRCSVRVEGRRVVVHRAGADVLAIDIDPKATIRLSSGEESTRSGWYSEAFGQRCATTQLVVTATVSPGAAIETALLKL